MKFNIKKLSQFQTLDDLEKEVFTDEEIKKIHDQAEARSLRR